MRTRWKFGACGATLLALSLSGGVPQGRAQDSNRQNQDQHGQSGGQNGQNNHQNQARDTRNQSRGNHDRFDEQDRQSTRDWYNQNRTSQGVRENDRLTPDYESRLQDGYVLDRSMRRMARPAPSDLTRNLGHPPRGYRYMIVNGHVVMVDRNYRVHDVIHLEQ